MNSQFIVELCPFLQHCQNPSESTRFDKNNKCGRVTSTKKGFKQEPIPNLNENLRKHGARVYTARSVDVQKLSVILVWTTGLTARISYLAVCNNLVVLS
jgi:hypothetical protein